MKPPYDVQDKVPFVHYLICSWINSYICEGHLCFTAVIIKVGSVKHTLGIHDPWPNGGPKQDSSESESEAPST